MSEEERSETKGETKPKSMLGMLGMIAFVLFKYKVFIISFGLSLVFYAQTYGFPWALAVILLLLMHEMGHFIWLQAAGLKPRMPIFIPFMGAITSMEELPESEATQAWTALAGPLIGGACAIAAYYWGVYNNLEFLKAAAYYGILLNLLQLTPARPLDGGFVMGVVAPWFRIPGALILLGIGILLGSPLFSILGIISLFMRSRREMKVKASIPAKLGIFATWLATGAVLLFVFFTGAIDMMHRADAEQQINRRTEGEWQ